jgi:hypothetical protein
MALDTVLQRFVEHCPVAVMARLTLERGPPDANDATVTLVGCWAHRRRYFFEAALCKYATGVEGLKRIREIYRSDMELADLPPVDRKRLRLERVLPRRRLLRLGRARCSRPRGPQPWHEGARVRSSSGAGAPTCPARRPAASGQHAKRARSADHRDLRIIVHLLFKSPES